MTSEAVRELALELSIKEMTGNRLKKHSQAAALKAQRDFLTWTERKGYALERMEAARCGNTTRNCAPGVQKNLANP